MIIKDVADGLSWAARPGHHCHRRPLSAGASCCRRRVWRLHRGERRGAGAYLSAKGVRDIVSGLVVFLLIATAGYRVLGGWMLVMTLIPIGDAVVVLRSGGSKATAYGVHVATAVFMAVNRDHSPAGVNATDRRRHYPPPLQQARGGYRG